MPVEGGNNENGEIIDFPHNIEGITEEIGKITQEISQLQEKLGHGALVREKEDIDEETKQKHLEEMERIKNELLEKDDKLYKLKDLKERMIKKS